MAQVTSGTVNTTAYDGRYYQLTWTSSQSIANNQTTMNWTLKAVGSAGSWYAERTLVVVIGGVTVYSKSARVERYDGVVATGTRVVNHNSAGDAHVDISIQAAVYTSAVNCTGSGSFDLANIPRKSTLSVANGTLGTAQTITVSRKTTSFTHTIEMWFGNAKETICTKSTSTSISWTPPLSFANQIPNAVQGVGTMTITTYNGNTSIGSNSYAVYLSVPSSVKPSIALSVTEATAISWGVYVQGNSQLDIAITPTTMYGATIKSYKTTIDGKSYTAKDFTTDVLKSSGELDIVSVITDSRGRTATYNGTIEVLAYNPPLIKNLKVIRCNSDGTANTKGAYAKVTYNYAFSSCGGKNSLEVKAQYKTKSANAYTTHATDNYTSTSLEGSVTEIFAASTASQYDVRIVATDALCTLFGKTSPTATANIGTIATFFSMFKQRGFSFGKVFDTSKLDSLQVGWNAYFDKDVYIKDKPVRVKRCVCGQNGNSDENPWHKFASVTANEINEDMRISFKITFAYGSVTRFGTLDVFVRTENANGANAFQNIIFESDTGLDVSNFVLAYSGTGVGAVYELWVKLSAYRFCQFEVLSESSRMAFVDKWTLYDSISLGEAAAPTSGYTQVTASRPGLLGAYPVGSYYIANHDTSPAELFGGTWHRIESRFLWACPSTSQVGLTGGASTHLHDDGTLSALIGSGTGDAYSLAFVKGDDAHVVGKTALYKVNGASYTSGGGLSHCTYVDGNTGSASSMPPYVNAAIWRRTA